MIVDVKIRERLSYFCMVNKLTQMQAANLALCELLERAEDDPQMRQRMDRAEALHKELASL